MTFSYIYFQKVNSGLIGNYLIKVRETTHSSGTCWALILCGQSPAVGAVDPLPMQHQFYFFFHLLTVPKCLFGASLFSLLCSSPRILLHWPTSSCLPQKDTLIFQDTKIGWGNPGLSQSVHDMTVTTWVVQSVWSSRASWMWKRKLAVLVAIGSHLLIMRAASLKTKSI